MSHPALPLRLAPPVRDALESGAPVVALESTIITHGMPWPRNLDTAREVECAVRISGVTPATIAVMDGRIHVGLDDGQLERLARAEDAAKLSRADLAVGLLRGGIGATTVAATMICARLAGIQVFATGGIGGVHRGAADSFDISADLQELARTPVTVVAAGAKAILDLAATLEALETLGVPVIGHGTDELPAFWSRRSGLRVPIRMDDPAEIAAAHLMRQRLGLGGGQLVANPVPKAAEIPKEQIDPLIDQALAEARAQGIGQKQVTPFLLSRVLELSGGRSLDTNVALVLNNARLAARIAAEIVAQRG